MPRDFKSRFALQVTWMVVSVLIVGGALLYLGNDIKGTAGEIVETRRDINTRQEQLNDLARLREEARAAAPRLEILEDALPERDELISLPDKLDSVAGEHDVLLRFSFGGDTEEGISFQMTLEGSYANIVAFLGELEGEFFYIVPEEVDVILRDNRYIATLKGQVYFNE